MQFQLYGDVDPKLPKTSIELAPFPIVSGSQGMVKHEKHSTYIVCREDKAIRLNFNT